MDTTQPTLTYAQWFEQIRALEHKSTQAQALIQQYPMYYNELRRNIRAALQQSKDLA